MPRKKYNVKPTLYNQKHDRYAKVKYTLFGKRGVKMMEVPLETPEGIHGVYSIIAKHHGCETADVWLEEEPLIITNIRKDDE